MREEVRAVAYPVLDYWISAIRRRSRKGRLDVYHSS
jgi:hypothetical protein